jgi:hypothetical protein
LPWRVAFNLEHRFTLTSLQSYGYAEDKAVSLAINDNTDNGSWTLNALQVYHWVYSAPSNTPKFTVFSYDLFNLGLNTFSISAVDASVHLNGTIAVYAADSTFGLRVFNATDPFNFTLTSSVGIHPAPISIGVCGDFLLVGDISEGVHKFSLEEPFKPVHIESYFKLGNKKGARGNIKCSASSNPQFAAVPLFNLDGYFTIRILDLYEQAAFSIFTELTLSGQSSFKYPGTFEFLANSVLTVVSDNLKADYQISSPVLTYPAMTKNQYQEMLEHWDTNVFGLFISAFTADERLTTTQFYLQRTGPTADYDDDSSHSVTLLISCFVGLSFC